MLNQMISISELENTIESARTLWNVPGVGVGVIHKGEVISSRGYGIKVVGKSEPVDAETNFAIGSNTKAFTAASIGMLVEEGKLSWDDKVIKYLPDFQVYDPWVTQNVTIRDILSHRIGVCDVERLLYNTTYSNEEIIRRLRYVQPSEPFRAGFVYSNIAFMVAGEIIQRVTGDNWESFVQNRIFNPLGMQHSTTNFLDAQKLENIASPHINPYSGLLSMHSRMIDPVQPIPWYDFGSQAAGGITSNVTDMAKWLSLFLGNGTYHGNKILSPETVASMIQPTSIIQKPSGSLLALKALNAESNFWTYGLGWFVFDYKGRKLVFHSGQVQGMISMCGFVPQENLGFVILTNINLSIFQLALGYMICDIFLGGSQKDWSQECYKLITHIRRGEEEFAQKRLSAREKNTQPALPLDLYTGIYEHDYFGMHTVRKEDGHLTIHFPPNLVGDLEHWQDNEYLTHWRNDPFETGNLKFILGDKGQVDGFEIENEGYFKKLRA